MNKEPMLRTGRDSEALIVLRASRNDGYEYE
jgi:hypothetical protein